MSIRNKLVYSATAIGVFGALSAHASCGTTQCNVADFTGTDTQRIQSAIDDAIANNIPIVYIPNGTYSIDNSIFINQSNVDVIVRGQSKAGVKLVSTGFADSSGCLIPTFNIDRNAGFSSLDLTIERLTIDMGASNATTAYNSSTGCSSGGHGVRVGNGWQTGSLRLNELNIYDAPGYGIGVQNSGASDIPADNLTVTSVKISGSGSDAFDSKAPPSRANRNLTMIDVTVSQFGFNDYNPSNPSAVSYAHGIDIRYDNSYLKRVTIVSDATRTSASRGNQTFNSGIVFRPDTHDGTVRDFYIKNPQNGVVFSGTGAVKNDNITLKNFIIKDFPDAGIKIAGSNLTMFAGCSFSGSGGSQGWEIDQANTNMSTLSLNIADFYGPACPAYSAIGSNIP